MGDIPFNPNKITNVPGMNQSADMSSVMVDKRGIGDLSATEVNLIINPATVPSRKQKREIFNKIADKEAREAASRAKSFIAIDVAVLVGLSVLSFFVRPFNNWQEASISGFIMLMGFGCGMKIATSRSILKTINRNVLDQARIVVGDLHTSSVIMDAPQKPLPSGNHALVFGLTNDEGDHVIFGAFGLFDSEEAALRATKDDAAGLALAMANISNIHEILYGDVTGKWFATRGLKYTAVTIDNIPDNIPFALIN